MLEEIIIRPRSPFSIGIAELWQHRELLFYFTWKEIKVRYKQAFLGIIWTIIQPLCMMAILMAVMTYGLGIEQEGIPAPLFYLSGLIIWQLFSQAVNHASQSMVTHASIIKKIYFPRLIIPVSSLIVATFDFVVSMLLFGGICIYYTVHHAIDISWVNFAGAIIAAYCITITMAMGLGTLLSAINVKYRDVRYALPFAIQVLFFATPVMFDPSRWSSTLIKNALELNPLAYAIGLVRHNIQNEENLYSPTFWPIGVGLIILYVIGIYVFRKTEHYLADII